MSLSDKSVSIHLTRPTLSNHSLTHNTTNRSVLIAGAGYVSRPVGEILAKNGVAVTFGCRTLDTAQKLAQQVGSNVKAITLDVRNKEQMDAAVKGMDLVVSLVPPPDRECLGEIVCVWGDTVG